MLSQQHYRTKHLDDEITEDEFSEALGRNGKDTAPGQDARTGLGEERIVARKLVRDLQDWDNSPSESGGIGQRKRCSICVAIIIMHERKKILEFFFLIKRYSLTRVKLTSLYKQPEHTYIHFNKLHHSRHVNTPTYTQSIGTEIV